MFWKPGPPPTKDQSVARQARVEAEGAVDLDPDWASAWTFNFNPTANSINTNCPSVAYRAY